MPPQKFKVLGAMFDVKPIDDLGFLDVSKISAVSSQINLRRKKNRPPLTVRLDHSPAPRHSSLPLIRPIAAAVVGVAAAQTPELTKEEILREIETTLHAGHDSRGMLARAGAAVQETPRRGRPRYRPVIPVRRSREEAHHKNILAEIYKPAYAEPQLYEAPIPSEVALAAAPSAEIGTFQLPDNPYLKSAEMDVWLDDFKQRSQQHTLRRQPRPRTFRGFLSGLIPQSGGSRMVIATFLVAILTGVGAYGFMLKNRIMEEGNAAVRDLENAKASLANLDFAAASTNFLSAYQSFSRAGEELNFLGANVSSLLTDLPGGGTLKSAQNMIEVGKLMANTGQAMAQVVDAIAQTGSILNPAQSSQVVLSQVVQPLTEALVLADANFKKAGPLLASIDVSVLPPDKQEVFAKFKDQFPEFQALVGDGVEYAKFLETLIGVKGSKKYLFLFQNYSELRPTGGFPGSYALVTFENGKLKELMVDDIYNPDGQLKELIVPPRQLQHITPTWAMRDASWFIDFPTSARKVMSFYKKEAGHDIDGVITVSPQIIINILKLVGPIEMPEYKVTITHENFLSEVQSEVEYGDNKKINKPKKILMDMAPILLQRLYSAERDTWLEVFNVFLAGMDQKDVMMYFKDLNLESFALEKGYAGEVKRTMSDYLMVTFTNIKGSKTDLVTDSSVKVDTRLEDGTIRHKLTITRTHNGGRNQYGFYNKQNPAFVRVLVPKGSRFLGISGNTKTGFKPLIDYSKEGFVRDEDLVRLEKTFHDDELRGVSVYEESDKTGFAFWLVTDPGASATVELEYEIPENLVKSDYELYVQKQPGLSLRNFEFNFAKPQDMAIVESKPALQLTEDSYSLSGELTRDLSVSLKLKR